ncbi:unnamed protein product [Fusarium graminearum]|uniref:Uncharacterized protein n=1 Tax=Gibberella zeae TaxID=5518 RepID=A0A2H3HCR7_GIBZA|nr:hypothetical protein FG05_05030 [Fusarium graminearum]KAI6757815.1 hypothetical protein HG531_003640 [Fusarium graminearum]PCD39906.1 hypothetical protein FGRA07_01177 [Fusarium graminearum]CAG1965453.1 unnamed protein product [Fusarium graminearum]CAG1965849.1 unnamed protein product [Fusarium graminearum]
METFQQQLEPASPKKRKPHEPKKSRVAVHVPSRRKDYIPGKGPALQRISLLPPQDSTAYILERIILPSPGLAADGNPLPRRMTYSVAWHDLPAAQLLVPAMDILEYVSPRELEEWEFANTEEQMEQEINKEQEQTSDAPKPKRRGRPPKHSKIETAVVAVPDEDDNAVQRGAMTIATPTKNRLKDFEGLSDEDATPAAQLQWETTGETDDQGIYDRGDSDDFGSARADALADNLRDSGSAYHKSQNHTPIGQFESSSSEASSSRQSTPKVTAIKSATKGKRKTDRPKKKTALDGVFNGLQGAESASESVWSPQGTSTYSNSGVETPDPEPRTATARLIEEAASVQKKKKKSLKNSKSEKQPKPESKTPMVLQPEESEEPDEQEEPDWEVKRIEGMDMYEAEEAGLVRYFKVRWEGDWPPDQNPTWEPESNLPDQLVRRYLKNRKRKRSEEEKPKKPATTRPPVAPSYRSRKSMKQTTLSWGIAAKQYRSVTEAFEGLEEDELAMPQYDEAPIEEEERDEDELFIVEEPPTKKSRVKTWVGNGLDL